MRDTASTTIRKSFLLWALALLSVPAFLAAETPAAEEAEDSALSGKVLGEARPQADASVYVYEVASQFLRKVSTDAQGLYAFDELPSGLYKVVAFKEGFVPAVELLLRRSEKVRQSLELKMVEERLGDVREAEDFWAVRGRIPVDVLRDISGPEFATNSRWEPADPSVDTAGFETRMAALGGVEQLGEGLGEAQVTGARVDVSGAVGEVGVDIQGEYQQITPTAANRSTFPAGEARTVAVHVAPTANSRLSVVGTSGELASLNGSESASVGLDHYRVNWTGKTGRKGHSSVTAQYTQESGYYRPTWADSFDVPEASRTWKVEGAYARDVTEKTSLRTGLRYHQRRGELFEPGEIGALGELAGGHFEGGHFEEETVGLYGVADSRLGQRVLVEVGLFSRLRDGGLSLMPHGGVVVELGDGWRGRAAISHRLEDERDRPLAASFTSAFYSDGTTCQDVGESCYEVRLSRELENGTAVSLGAIHREYAETLRLYFNPDFFNRLENLMLVRGDEVPELQFSLVRHLAPRVLAKLESSYGSGGGGILYATDSSAYENQVRYLVTSLDTRFQATSTGVFVSFQQLEQTLDGEHEKGPNLELQRLQVMLTQDLDALVNLATNWAVNLNMELSRGSNPYTLTPDDETRKKLTGGFSVSF